MGKSIYDKIFESHIVGMVDDETYQLYVDRHLIHEVTSPQAFQNIAASGRSVRKPESILAVADHNVPTDPNRLSSGISDPVSQRQVDALVENTRTWGIPYFPLDDPRQGIVHIVGPEQGMTHPGMLVVCGDSHTSTHGAFGALAFGIGTSEVEHVLATQTLLQKRAKNYHVSINGVLPIGVYGKDVVLSLIARIGTAGGTGHVIEYSGSAIEKMSMESRMTICNMTIEAGARAGLMQPDETTFEYLKGRPLSPGVEYWQAALEHWENFLPDSDAEYSKMADIDVNGLEPFVTWGTSPEDGISVLGKVPDPSHIEDPIRTRAIERSLEYMGLEAGQPVRGLPIDQVFVGSCTNGRIEDLRLAASVVRGRQVNSRTRAWVVPGSGLVKRQAEEEGLAKVFVDAGFEWREPGCSMCLGMNPDRLQTEERCVSTSNRNFEGRQGRGGRTHLASPATAAASAIAGYIEDPRELITGQAD
ncbi:3-isopropylmalate dehydratase large subunit [Sneathiella chungangensis]|uniref:3-isopropylmalate dehydratase large subunit n=1 Tax=Sneathiella chungangensis TaxID=1418234 RepID=A0A845MK95_9PROT|nr:3-isopropylmalate dehydratase large subunit [Sneathiella chungangensis]MZR24348.1 3-isopropylmalate dehydratase large subunit [Sneathiella chungangensis]